MTTNNKLMDAAIRLFHKSERENKESMFRAIDGDFKNHHELNLKLWFWACKRWGKEFTYREYELRED